VGWPEARIPIAEAAIYIATAHKSNSSIAAIDAALEDVRSGRTLAVPEHLRDAHYKSAKRLGHGEGYEYAHDHPEHFVAQDYLGSDKHYYEPSGPGDGKENQGTGRKMAGAAGGSKETKMTGEKNALRAQIRAGLKRMPPPERTAGFGPSLRAARTAGGLAEGAVGLVLRAVAGGTGRVAAADDRAGGGQDRFPAPFRRRTKELRGRVI